MTGRSGRESIHDAVQDLYEAWFDNPLLRSLGAISAAGLLAVLHAGSVERAADDLVAHARQVANTTAAHQDDRVLLQVVALTGDVGRDLDAAGEADTGHLAHGRVRLLRGVRVHPGAHATALR